MSTKNMTIEERKAYLDQLMCEREKSKPEIGDSVNYYTDFENYLRTAKVEDSLKAGSDKEGGYLVPNEYHDKLIQKLEDEHVIRKLATVFTVDHNISIPGVSKHGVADWISEGVPYPESDEEFNGMDLGAHKNGCITIVTDELLEDSAFSIEDYRNFLHELRKLGRVERRRPQAGGDKTTLLIGFSIKDEEDFMS